MAGPFGASTKLDFEDNEVRRSRSKKQILLVVIFIVVLVLAVLFLALYLRSEKDLRKANNDLQKAIDGSTPTKKPTQKTTTQIVTTTVDPSKPYANIRLPKNVLPMHYDVKLTVNLNNRDVDGKANITVVVSSPTKYFIVHAYDFETLTGVARDRNGVLMKIKRSFLFKENQYHVIELPSEVQAETYYLEYEFDYELKKNLKGFYQSTYKTKSGEERVVAATQFQPVDARTAFPCFDEPAMKATFKIAITHDKSYHAIGNMPVENMIEVADKKQRTEFKITPKMPTYLVAFVVCDFASKKVTANARKPVEMTYYAPSEQIDQIDYSMEVGSKILSFFEEYYNVSYPLPKADMIAIPDFAAGAMENWGLITYRARALLFDDEASSISNKKYVASVVSHELAHQWFGNIVTMEWWSDLWLNEGFASYVEYLGVNSTHPEWNLLDFQVTSDMATGLNLDSLVTSHPIFIEVKHPDEINEIFDAISYQKGGSILRMLDDFLGTDVFVEGLNTYLRKYSYGNAKTSDLWEELSKASCMKGSCTNVSEIMNTWILQMGFPVVNVSKQNDGTFKLTQSRFLRDPNPNLKKSNFTSPYGYKWEIPFNYVALNVTDLSNIQAGSRQRTLISMKQADATIPSSSNASSSNDFIIKGNAGQYGFYRVNYDANGWKTIIGVLQNNHEIFDPKDRAGLLADAFALANSARLDYATALDLFDYIDKDDQYIPWKAASDSISLIPSLLTSTRPSQKLYKNYILKKVTPLYEKYGFKQIDNFLERYLQVLVVSLACGSGHKYCISNATELFQNYMKDPITNQVPSDFRSLVYFYGIYNGGEQEWDFLFKQYQTNKIASEKGKLMYGLAAIQEPWMLNRWLNYGLNGSIVKSQDVSYVFSYVANSNPIGRYNAWNFMKENWATIEKRFAQSFFAIKRIFSSVTSGFTTQYELDQMSKFVATIKNPGTATRIITQSEENIKSNIEWLNSNEPAIEKWLTAKSI